MFPKHEKKLSNCLMIILQLYLRLNVKQVKEKDSTQPVNIGLQDVPRTPYPPTLSEHPLNILLDHPGNVLIWLPKNVSIWHPRDVPNQLPGEVLWSCTDLKMLRGHLLDVPIFHFAFFSKLNTIFRDVNWNQPSIYDRAFLWK